MNKNKLKKRIESNNINNLMTRCHFIGFFCMQNISVNDKIKLKKNLNKQGFKYTLIKNTAIFKSLFSSVPKMRGIFSGSLAICYNEKTILKDFNFIKLKEVFSIIKKEKHIFFLGGFYKSFFINRLFEVKVCTLKNMEFVNIENIYLIQNVLTNITKTLSKPKNQLSFLLSNKTK